MMRHAPVAVRACLSITSSPGEAAHVGTPITSRRSGGQRRRPRRPKPPAAGSPARGHAGSAPRPAKDDEKGLSRRRFMKWSLPVGWVAFSAACASSLVATARFLFPNVLFEPPQSFKAGFPGEYNVGEVDTRWKDAFGVWIVREPDGFYALIAVCTHLGCSPNWLPAENKFKCPCHGSGFYTTRRQLRGPGAPARSSARASCSPTTARSWWTSP